jgi:hypothetical protein
MGLAVEAPAREDQSFRSNDDKIVGAIWYANDGVTPVVVTSAKLTLEFDTPTPTDPSSPAPSAQRHVIDSAVSDPSNGDIHGPSLAQGRVIVTVPHGIWSQYDTRTGNWDLVAVSNTGLHRCLLRGLFVCEEGVTQ